MKSLHLIVVCFVFSLANAGVVYGGFEEDQLKYSRVREARDQKNKEIEDLFSAKEMPFPPKGIFVRVFKEEKLLEVWVRPQTTGPFKQLKTYDICATSGELGPKRQEGDLQIPEGVYSISHFNPVSSYHLSLKINYPNKSDRILGVKGDLGGDIFIHGDCVTIGCVPVTDAVIKELYWIAVQAREAGQSRIPVHIYPFRMNDVTTKEHVALGSFSSTLVSFWGDLKLIHDHFESKSLIPAVSIDDRGRYKIESSD